MITRENLIAILEKANQTYHFADDAFEQFRWNWEDNHNDETINDKEIWNLAITQDVIDKLNQDMQFISVVSFENNEFAECIKDNQDFHNEHSGEICDDSLPLLVEKKAVMLGDTVEAEGFIGANLTMMAIATYITEDGEIFTVKEWDYTNMAYKSSFTFRQKIQDLTEMRINCLSGYFDEKLDLNFDE